VHFERLAIFGILFRNDALRIEKILERYGQSANKAPRTRNATLQVAFNVLNS
jgi:hypothetical protein